MASTLYDADGNICVINDALQVAGMLASGRYFPRPPVSKSVADTNKTGKLSAKEIRETAQLMGYPDWETAKLADLRARLWPPKT